MVIKTFKALAEPNRLRIVELLKEKPYSVNEFAELLDIRQPQASKHLKILNEAGLVFVNTVAQRHIYSLNPESFCQLDEWVNSFSALWNNRLDNLDVYLRKTRKDQDGTY